MTKKSQKQKKKYKRPSNEAIEAANKIPNLTLLERVIAAEMIQEGWDRIS